MFKLAEEIMAKIETVLTANQPILASENNIQLMAGGCLATCTGTCAGSCKNTCTRSCQRNSR